MPCAIALFVFSNDHDQDSFVTLALNVTQLYVIGVTNSFSSPGFRISAFDENLGIKSKRTTPWIISTAAPCRCETLELEL